MAHSYWDKLTPEERSAEMKRRQQVAKGNKKLAKRQANSRVKHYTCKKCGEKFDDKYSLANHVRYQHPKRGKRKGGASGDGSAQEGHSKDGLEAHAAYLFGKCETIIEYYASSNGIPQQALAERVSTLLRHPQGR